MPHPYRIDPSTTTSTVETAARIAREVLREHAAVVDAKGRFPVEGVRALGEAGLLGLCVPTALGGRGLGLRAFAAVADELAQGCASTAMIFVMHVAAQQAIASSKTLARRDEVLREMAAGRHLSTLALSESGSRSHFWAPVSRLVRDGSGYRASAKKSWVTSATHAQSYVASSQKPDAASPLESTVYLVDPKAEGVRVAGGFDGLGLRGNDSAPVALDGVRVAAGDLVGAEGTGAQTKLEVVLPWFALGTSAMANGLAAAAVADTAAHLSSSRLEHLDQALRDLQVLRARVATMATRVAQSRALVGWTLDEMEAASPTAPLSVLEMRLAALEMAVDVTDGAMKACGGAAFSRHLGVERRFRDARAGWVMAPTVDHLQDFVGKALTGLPLF